MSDIDEELENEELLYEELEDDEDADNKAEKHFTFKSYNSQIELFHLKYGKKTELVMNPDYQRHYVWDDKRASKLIDSILINIPLPAIFLARKQDGTAVVIDGQQRLTSIFRFIDGDFKLTSTTNPAWKNKYFKELTQEERRSIENYNLIIIEIDASKDDNSQYKMFERLNTGSVKLNAQEIRNSVYHGSYNDFIKELAKSKIFRATVGGDGLALANRMVYEELVLRFFTVRKCLNNGIYKVAKNHLSQQMELHKSYNEQLQKEDLKVFEKTFNLIHDIFGDTAFAPYTSHKSSNSAVPIIGKTKKIGDLQLNQGLYMAMVYIFSRVSYDKNMLRAKKDAITQALINLCIDEGEFKEITLKGSTNDAKNLKLRTDILEKTLNTIMAFEEPTSRLFTYAFKKELYDLDPTCKICHNKINDINQAEVDHILAYANGGKTTPDNAQLAHYYCNRQKSAKQ